MAPTTTIPVKVQIEEPSEYEMRLEALELSVEFNQGGYDEKHVTNMADHFLKFLKGEPR